MFQEIIVHQKNTIHLIILCTYFRNWLSQNVFFIHYIIDARIILDEKSTKIELWIRTMKTRMYLQQHYRIVEYTNHNETEKTSLSHLRKREYNHKHNLQEYLQVPAPKYALLNKDYSEPHKQDLPTIYNT